MILKVLNTLRYDRIIIEATAMIFLKRITLLFITLTMLQSTCLAFERTKKIDVALYIDQGFIDRYGGESRAREKAAWFLEQASIAFEESGVFNTVRLILQVEGPFVFDRNYEKLDRDVVYDRGMLTDVFQPWARENYRGDVAVLLSGHNDEYGGGRASGTACKSTHTAINMMGDRPNSRVIKTLAHEIGHLLHFSHGDGGIMEQGDCEGCTFTQTSKNTFSKYEDEMTCINYVD